MTKWQTRGRLFDDGVYRYAPSVVDGGTGGITESGNQTRSVVLRGQHHDPLD